MSKSAEILFRLLRAALGQSAEASEGLDLGSVSGKVWKEVVELSFKQCVAAIAVDGLQNLCELHTDMELALDSPELESLKYEWFGEVFAREEDYRRYVRDIVSLARTYSAAGIETMILKGYGLSLYYPIPAHRPTGDVDIYLFGKWREADELLSSKGITIDYSHHHHSVFSWNGQMVENHYDIENRYADKDGKLLDDLLKELAGKGRKEVEVDGVKLYFPTPVFNGIFLIQHSASHFAGEHITLRHLLDWALFVDKEWKDIDWQFVVDWLSRLGLLRFLSCMNALSIGCLGISAEKFPSLERDSVLEERVLNDIISPSFNESGSGFLFKLRRLRANMWKRNLVSPEPLVPRMVRLAWSHVIGPSVHLRK